MLKMLEAISSLRTMWNQVYKVKMCEVINKSETMIIMSSSNIHRATEIKMKKLQLILSFSSLTKGLPSGFASQLILTYGQINMQ